MPAVQRAGRRVRPRLAGVPGRARRRRVGGLRPEGVDHLGAPSQFGVLLARTDPDEPKRKGITYFLIDLHQPGVEVRALRHIGGEVDFNEVFLDGARVPDTQRVGEVGDGWKVANATLSGERQMVSGSGSGGVDRIGGSGVERLIRGPRSAPRPGSPAGGTSRCVRQELMRLYSEETIRGWTNQRVRANLKAGRSPGPSPPSARSTRAALNQRIQALAVDLLGSRGAGVGAGRRAGRPDRLRRLAHLRGQRHAPQPRQHDRGRHDRGEQEHPRRARARPAPRARPVPGRPVARGAAQLMADYETLRVERRGAVGWLVFDRPEAAQRHGRHDARRARARPGSSSTPTPTSGSS